MVATRGKWKFVLGRYSREAAQPIVVVYQVEAPFLAYQVLAELAYQDVVVPGVGEEIALHTRGVHPVNLTAVGSGGAVGHKERLVEHTSAQVRHYEMDLHPILDKRRHNLHNMLTQSPHMCGVYSHDNISTFMRVSLLSDDRRPTTDDGVKRKT